jgi:predicted acetyltransferase
LEINRIIRLEPFDIQPILIDSIEDGHHFVERLNNEYYSGTNCFDKPGEALYLARIDNEIAGIGGLNQDPYIKDKDFGRVRHLYVLRKFRRRGVGKAILSEIINEAIKHYKILGLRTYNDVAGEMYCSNGFIKGDKFERMTHYLMLKTESK